jgi:hypothetical protein
MSIKKITDDPRITDTIEIDFVTEDDYGNPIDPYRVDTVVVYFIERDFTANTYKTVTQTVNEVVTTMFYTDAVPVYSFGSQDIPAWDSTDTANAKIFKNTNDTLGNVLTGDFTATWKPVMAREGDYFVCYTWTQYSSSSKVSAYQSFFVHGDTLATTAIPSHRTQDGKYETLLDAYLPEMYKLKLSSFDLTPDVLNRFHQAIAKGFTTIEDLANQLIDLMDANICHEAFLPYLSNLFDLKLRSTDPTLWRRQIKTAIPSYKQKGTLQGLKDSLSAAGITFQKLTQYWQVVSKSTWQDGFVVTDADQTEFALSEIALLPIDEDNFELAIRYHDTEEYVIINNDYASFTTTLGVTTMTWIPDAVVGEAIPIEANDVIRVLYKVKAVTNQSVENYIRSLPLADKRDETLVSNPMKNWNVRLLSPDDPMFAVIVSNAHPFHHPVVWGKVRTEFAYSENVYNMDEYNGSNRDSNIACDIDGSFVDSCSNCMGSVISVDVEIENLSNDRIVEAGEIIRDNVPFHAQIDSVNYSGAVNEYFLPPTEDIEILLYLSHNENILLGQDEVTRGIPNINDTSGMLTRSMLSTSSTAVSSTAGTVYNDAIVLFSPEYRFDTLNLDLGDNVLQILNGANAGRYTVNTPLSNTVAIASASPNTVPFPLSTAAFSFNLSNVITTDLSAAITQDDLYVFSELGQDLVSLPLQKSIDSATPSRLVVTTGTYAGTYTIYDLLPDNTIVIKGFPATSNVASLKYRITNNDQTITLLNRSSNGSGAVKVTRRGLVSTIDLQDDWGVVIGDYISYNGTDYKITSFADSSSPYIAGYVGGTVAGVTIGIYRRIVDVGTGYVDVRGFRLVTSIDYEAALSIQNGSNPPAVKLENNSFMENFLVLIGSNYYIITGWNGTNIALSGPKASCGVSGAAATFTIYQYDNVSPVDHISQQYDNEEVQFERLDRRGNEPVTYSTQSLSMAQKMMLGSSALNNGSGGNEIVEQISTDEFVSFTIEWDNGTTEERSL